MQFSHSCLATCALLFDARSSTNDLDGTRYFQVRLNTVWHIRVEPQHAVAGSERSGSCGPACTLEIPCRPIAPRFRLAPHSIPNQIQSRPDDLQSTTLKGTKLS